MEIKLSLFIVLTQLGSSYAKREGVFTKRSDYSDSGNTEHTLFETSARSLVSCATKCLLRHGCVRFTWTPYSSVTSLCRGHSVVMTSESDVRTSSVGAVTYVISDDENPTTAAAEDSTVATDPFQLPTYHDVSAWLGIPCAKNTDCSGASYTQCYEGQCNCAPGYYFSVSRDSCVKGCAQQQLGTGFTTYNNGNINSRMLDGRWPVDLTECFRFCRSFPNCRSIEYTRDTRFCMPMENTPEEADWSTENREEQVYFQRFCA